MEIRPDSSLHTSAIAGARFKSRLHLRGWLGSTPEGRRPQIRGFRAAASLAVARSTPATQFLSPAKKLKLNHARDLLRRSQALQTYVTGGGLRIFAQIHRPDECRTEADSIDITVRKLATCTRAISASTRASWHWKPSQECQFSAKKCHASFDVTLQTRPRS